MRTQEISNLRQPLAFLNGEFIPFSEARLPVYDLGIVQGASLSERLRTVRHVPYLVDSHLARLRQSLSQLSWELPSEFPSLENVILELAGPNTSLIAAEEDLAIAIFVTAGQAISDANGCVSTSRHSVCVYTTPLPLAVWAQGYAHGISLACPGTRQLPADVIDPRIKNRSRLHWQIADAEAKRIDPQALALLLDHNQHVTETSSGNLFVVRHGELHTPSEATTLPGIAQAQVTRIAGQLGWKVRRLNLTVDDVAHADECFLTSSTYCMLPVAKLNGQTIGSQIPGPMTNQLMEKWSTEMKLDFAAQALHRVGKPQ